MFEDITTIQWIAIGIAVYLALRLFSGSGEDQVQTDNVEIRPEPMDGLPDHQGVYLDGSKIGNITPNPKHGGWSATTSNRAMHDIENQENAIAAVLRDHYGDQRDAA